MTKKKSAPPESPSLYAHLFPLAPSRAQKRIVAILDAAIESYATHGIDNTTYDSIAKLCGVTRPLIQHYFESKRDIFELTVKYVRANFQRLAVEAIQREETADAQLEAYVRATFVWVKQYRKHVLVWLLFYYYCGVDRKLRAVNTELVAMGHERIMALLDKRSSGRRKRAALAADAKMIQTIITGALTCVATEDLPLGLDDYVDSTVEACLSVARRSI